MSELFFLPDLTGLAGHLPWYALLLLCAAIAGEAVQRFLRLPRLLGWITAGGALGPYGIGALDANSVTGLHPVLNVAIGVVLFELGQRVDLSWMRRNPSLLATSLLETGLSFGLMLAVLLALGAPPLLAAAAAAIGIATSPAVVLSVVRELRAQGQVAERAMLLASLNTVYAVIAVNVLLAWLAREYAGDWRAIVLHPLYLIFGSVALAALFAAVTLALLRQLGRRNDAQFLCVLALVVIAVWSAAMLKLSLALTLLAYGALARILDRGRMFVSLEFGMVGRILLILLFSITAASLDWALLGAGLFAGFAFVAARLAGKAIGVLALAPASGLPMRKASLLALTLTPMSGVAIVLMHETSRLYPQFGPALAAVVVSGIVLMELLGPLLVHFALLRSGDGLQEGRA